MWTFVIEEYLEEKYIRMNEKIDSSMKLNSEEQAFGMTALCEFSLAVHSLSRLWKVDNNASQ